MKVEKLVHVFCKCNIFAKYFILSYISTIIHYINILK